MRISIDLVSVADTARVLSAAADEYDTLAAALGRGDELGGVTGTERHWLLTSTQSVAARLRSIAATHRETANELSRRCTCAGAKQNTSPLYAGTTLAAAPNLAGTMVAFDRDGDGINDTTAVDSDGDGYFETFALDREQDGVYDTILVSDTAGNLVGAGFDWNQDGHLESFVGVTATGPVWLTDADGDNTYDQAPGPPATIATPTMAPTMGLIGGNSFSDDFTITSGSAGIIGGSGVYFPTTTAAGLVGPAIIGGHSWSDGISASEVDFGPAIVGGTPTYANDPFMRAAIRMDREGRDPSAMLAMSGHMSNVESRGIARTLSNPNAGDPYYSTTLDDDRDGVANAFDSSWHDRFNS